MARGGLFSSSMPTSLVGMPIHWYRRRRLPRVPPLRSPAGRGPPGHLRRQPRDRLAGQHPPPARAELPLRDVRHHPPLRGRRGGRLRLPHGLAGEPDRLRPSAAAHAEGRRLRHPQHARAGQEEPRALPAGLDVRGLRRPARAPSARELLGQRQPDRPARGLRRGQALRRGADHGLQPPAGRGHGDRADLQHLRPAHAPARRPGGAHLLAPGARGQAGHGVRRRLADALASASSTTWSAAWSPCRSRACTSR